MKGNEKSNHRTSEVGDKLIFVAHRRANKFYNVKQSGQTAAVVETVFRKPKAFANLHEYDCTGTVDQVPTAIGFNSFDSADDVMEAKMKSRYLFEELTKRVEQLKEEEVSKSPEMVSSNGEDEENDSSLSQQRHVQFRKVILRKVEDRAPRANVEEQQIVVEQEREEDSTVENEKQEKTQEHELEGEIKSNDRYGLGQSIFSDDDSCPPLWKSFSDENNGMQSEGSSAAAKEKARRQTALNEARKLRALNSIKNVDDQKTLEVDIGVGVDARLRRNTAGPSRGKKTSSIQDKSSSRKVLDSHKISETRQESVQTSAFNSNNRKNPVSVVSNSIVASQPLPRKVAVKAMTFDSHFDDASYGSEGQSKSSDERKKHTMTTETNRQLETEQSFAACVYQGLTNLTNIFYWMGEHASSDGNREVYEESRDATIVSSKNFEKGTVKRDSKATKSSPAIVSEITIPTSVRSRGELCMEDSVSILGLDKKQSNRETTENRENRVPQKMKKQKGKGRVFGKLLGRKTTTYGQ